MAPVKEEEPKHLSLLKAAVQMQDLEEQNRQYKYILTTRGPLMSQVKAEELEMHSILAEPKPKPKVDMKEVNRANDKMNANLPNYCFECGAYIEKDVDKAHRAGWYQGRHRGKLDGYKDAFFIACLLIGIMVCFFIFGFMSGPLPLIGMFPP